MLTCVPTVQSGEGNSRVPTLLLETELALYP